MAAQPIRPNKPKHNKGTTPVKVAKIPKAKLASKMDFNQLAQSLVARSTEQHDKAERKATPIEISRVMAELGRRGGKIGGKNRAESMTAEQRSNAAALAARARWAKQ